MRDNISGRYRSALTHFLEEPGEPTLKSAYDLGHSALTERVGVLQILSIHGRFLERLISGAKTVQECARLVQEAQAFLTETLSAFDVAQTGYRSAISEMRNKTEELARSNADLDTFASVTSHDLQEPLRKIISFGDLLRIKDGARLSDEGKDYLNRIQAAATRMSRKIQDLLQYSRISTVARAFAVVDLEGVVRNILSDLEARVRESGGNVRVEALPSVVADPVQMEQLFLNLISNALKFHKAGEPPDVLVRCIARRPKRVEIAVEDHGIGFDEKYRERIFKPFQRLHSPEQYEGTGMGLAICQKIVSRHGGSIWVRSAVGLGTSFFITLPAPD